MKNQFAFSQNSKSLPTTKCNSDSVKIDYLNKSSTSDIDHISLLSISELENMHAGSQAFGYGASYHTSSYQPSIMGFVTYLFTGYINGFRFSRFWEEQHHAH
jgi:hypothetical protein